MHSNVDELFSALWQDYIQLAPSAHRVHQLLARGEEEIINDHIALRTFNLDPITIDALSAHFELLGYRMAGEYQFKEKKLFAKHFEHENPALPKVFISQLLVEQLSATAQQLIKGLVAQMDPEAVKRKDFLYSGTHWKTDYSTYKTLLQESEYAAWMAAYGFRVNHFTVNVNSLSRFAELAEVNDALKQAGFELNTSGGEIKGSPEVKLEQSSTLADRAKVQFVDTEVELPSCFYEFAKRYEVAEGKLYSGFVAASADKIFESTNNR